MMNKFTGAKIDQNGHIRQSINTILSTVIGTRIQRRQFGSFLFDMVDRSLTPRTQQLLIAVIAHAIAAYETRVSLESTQIKIDSAGRVTIDTITTTNQALSVDLQL